MGIIKIILAIDMVNNKKWVTREIKAIHKEGKEGNINIKHVINRYPYKLSFNLSKQKEDNWVLKRQCNI